MNSLAGFAREYGGSSALSPAPESRQLRRLLVVRHVFTIGQVERDIEKVHDFFVSFDRYFKAMLEDVAQILFDLLCLSGRCSRYSEAVVSVQAKVVAMFLMFHLDAVQEVRANEFA